MSIFEPIVETLKLIKPRGPVVGWCPKCKKKRRMNKAERAMDHIPMIITGGTIEKFNADVQKLNDSIRYFYRCIVCFTELKDKKG